MSFSEEKSSILNRITQDISETDNYEDLEKVLENYLEECKHTKAIKEDSDNQEYKERLKELWFPVVLNYCKDKTIVEKFLNKLLEKIRLLPEMTMYEVPAKHGDSIFYTLIFFETKEEYGFQKVLLDKYTLKYDSECRNWDFTSQEVLDKSFSIQEHHLYLSKYQIPKKNPENSKQEYIYKEYDYNIFDHYRIDYGLEGDSEERDLNEVDFEKILEIYPIWRIVVGMTDFDNL